MRSLFVVIATVGLLIGCGKANNSANPIAKYNLPQDLVPKESAGQQPRVEYRVQEKVVVQVGTVYVDKEVPVKVTETKYVDKEVPKIVEKFVVKEVAVSVDGRIFAVTIKDPVLRFVTGRTTSYPITIRALQGDIKFTASLENAQGATLTETKVEGNTRIYTISWAPPHGSVPSTDSVLISALKINITPKEIRDQDPKREQQIKEQLKVSTKAYEVPYVVVLSGSAGAKVDVKSAADKALDQKAAQATPATTPEVKIPSGAPTVNNGTVGAAQLPPAMVEDDSAMSGP